MHELLGLLLTIFFVGLFVDNFLLPSSTLSITTDIRLLLLLLFWLWIVRIFRFTSIATFKLTLVILIVLSILFIFAPEHKSVERMASWVYMLLVTGVVQQFFESRKEK